MASDSVAIDAEGRPLPFTGVEVDRITMSAIENGRIIAVIAESATGELAIRVNGPPTLAIVQTLEEVARAYRQFLEGQG